MLNRARFRSIHANSRQDHYDSRQTYQDPNRTYHDVANVLAQYPSLFPRTEVYSEFSAAQLHKESEMDRC